MPYERYFDHAATTPILPEVAERLGETWHSLFGNANSIHHPGKAAQEAVEWARSTLAQLIAAEDASEIVFTSGATEANNWVIANFERISISPFEHSSVREPALVRGAEVLGNETYALDAAAEETDLLSVMTVNNETGAILKLPAFPPSAKVHRDITQQVGKLEVDLTGVDFASMSGHKFGGLKGVGALYIRGAMPIEPVFRGGGQEAGLRAGTLNVPAIFAMGVAAEQAGTGMTDQYERIEACRYAVLDPVFDLLARHPIEGSPYILSLSFDGLEGEALVIELDRMGYAVSSGAACSTGSTEPSHVLMALGYPESLARGTIRVSFGWSSTVNQSAALGEAIREAAQRVRSLGR